MIQSKNEQKALKTLLRLADQADGIVRRDIVSELSWCLNVAHEAARERRVAMLNSYITYCALRIQANWRGFYTRNYWAPFLVRMGGLKRACRKFSSPINGWRTRQIMRLPEVQKRACSILDHDHELVRVSTDEDRADLLHSRKV